MTDQIKVPRGLSSSFEVVTPKLAREYLDKMPRNRKFKEYLMNKYAGDLVSHTFGITHQGIAFDETGALIDGQHRLYAIIHANVPAVLLVVRGLPVMVEGHRTLLTRDLIDGGKNRTVADNLYLNHNVENPGTVAAACHTVGLVLLGGFHTTRKSTATALAVLSIYGDEINQMVSATHSKKHARKALIVGTLAVCAKADFNYIDTFVEQLVSGEGVKRGMPVYALREHLIHIGTGGSPNDRLLTVEMVCNAFRNTVDGTAVTRVKSGVHGLEWVRAKQAKHIEKLKRGIAGQNGTNGAGK